MLEGVRAGSTQVVEHAGRVTGYTTGIAFFAHSVGETNEDLKALIGAASEFAGPGFLLPARNAELYRWSLAHGLKVVQVMTLMTLGLYNEPAFWARLPREGGQDHGSQGAGRDHRDR